MTKREYFSSPKSRSYDDTTVLPLMLFVANVCMAKAAGVVGTPTAASCTDAALNSRLSGGGLVTFNCGASPVTIDISGTGTETIFADTTIDGGGLITISGGNAVGVFFVNYGVTFTVENLTVANGNGAVGILIFTNGTLSVTNSCASRKFCTCRARRDASAYGLPSADRCIDPGVHVKAEKGRQAAVDIRGLPKLEGTVHVNIALIVKFMPNFSFAPADYPEVPRRDDAVNDDFLFHQGSTKGLAAIRFHDYQPVFDRWNVPRGGRAGCLPPLGESWWFCNGWRYAQT